MNAQILKNIAYHIDMTVEEESFFLSLLSERSINKGEVVLSPGRICRDILFVVQGCLRIYSTDLGAKDHTVAFFTEDWWALDASSFFSETPAFYTIEALEQTRVLAFGKNNLELLLENLPKFQIFFRILAQNGFIFYQERIREKLSMTAEERYEQFKTRYPTLEQRISQKNIATYLGITPVFLSILKKRNL